MDEVVGVSYNEAQRRRLLEFVQRIADMEVNAWERPGEDVVTMSKADCLTLIAIFDEARRLRGVYAGLPI